jgi:hypothetical protein
MTNKTLPKKKSFVGNTSKEQAKDAGMAVVLILLLLGIFLKQQVFYPYAAAALVVNMIFPGIYKPLRSSGLGWQLSWEPSCQRYY